ncbi:MAG: tetratricopeptide repeat protein [Nitrospirota bacterium]
MTTWRKRTGKKKEQFSGPDEFQSFSQKALLYVQENMKKFYIGLAVLAVVVVASAVWFMAAKSSHEKAAALMSKALKYYDLNSAAPGGKPMATAERLKTASGLFGQIASGGGKQADLALYYQANANFELGDVDKAIQEYDALKEHTKDPLLTSLANQRLASAYLEKSNENEAINVLIGDSKLQGSFFKDEDLFRLARILEQSGKTGEAIGQLETLVKEFPDSTWASDAKLELSKLTGKPLEAPQASAGTPSPTNIKVVPAPAPGGVKPAPAPTPGKK